jgi:hypothetical protein
VNVSTDELKEVESSHFTVLDQHHLFRCFLMHDAAGSLAVKGVRSKAGGQVAHEKPLDRAARAFAWVMRQVRLRPDEGEPEPPSYVLRRGWGTALERALIFLALLEQLGDPGVAEREVLGFLLQVPPPLSPSDPGGDKGGDKMRLWACGVVAGEDKEVYLFDPALGLPLPGPQGEGIATLAQARRQPDVLAQLNGGEKYRYPVTMEQARAAQAQLACPLSALAPRMHYLQDKLLAPAVRVRLTADAVKEVERIKAACAAGAEKPTHIAVPREMCTLLRRFLPTDEGGADTSHREVRFLRELVPWNVLPAVFQNEQLFPAKSKLRVRVHTLFVNQFLRTLEPSSPRELLLRGRDSSAVEKLVAERDALRRIMEQRANAVDLEAQFQKWLDAATAAEARQIRAKSPQEREQAEKQGKAVWEDRNLSWPIYVLVNGSAAVVRSVEVAYQLSLCSQEQAEQLQARLDLQARIGAAPFAADVDHAHKAWRNALENWQRFDQDVFQQQPDRPAARLLRARAESMLGDSQAAIASWKAVASWKNEAGTPLDLERVAALYLAQQAEKKHAAKGK